VKICVLDDALYEGERQGGFQPKMPGDAGIDLRARATVVVPFRGHAVVPLGVGVEIPPGFVGWLTGRSSTAITHGIITHEGKIDAGYRGEIHCLCTALERQVQLGRGERICQLVVVQIADPLEQWEIVDELEDSVRGGMGLGSTGRI